MGNYNSIRMNDEDGYGKYYVHLRITDVYDNLFNPATVFNTVQNVTFDSVKSEIDGDSYSIETQSIELQFDENKNKTAYDSALISEVLDSTSGDGSAMYFGIYVNESETPTFDYTDFVFVGRLTGVTVEAEISTLLGTEWNKTLGKKIYKIKCSNFEENILRNVLVSDLLDDFSYNDYIDNHLTNGNAYSDHVLTGHLINLSEVIEQIVLFVARVAPITIGYQFGDRAKVFDGLPARWIAENNKQFVYQILDDGGITQNKINKMYARGYKTFSDDISSLYIDFDRDTTDWEYEQIYVSSVICQNKPYYNSNNIALEKEVSGIKNFSFAQYKNCYDLLFAIAENLDLVLSLYITRDLGFPVLNVNFIAKRDYIQSIKYFKDATAIDLTATNEVDDNTDTEKPYYRRSYYGADEGWKVVVDDIQYDNDTTETKKKGNKKLLFTISPTECIIHKDCLGVWWNDDDYDKGKRKFHTVKLPLNHFALYNSTLFSDLNEDNAIIKNQLALHSGIYCFVDLNTDYFTSNTPTNYYTPIAQIVEKINIDGHTEQRVYERMDDFLNRHYEDIRNDFASEINIDIPYCQGFSDNNTGTIPNYKQIQLGDYVSLGSGSEFMITSIERDFFEMKTKLKGISTSAFDAYEAFTGDLPINDDTAQIVANNIDKYYSGVDLDPNRVLCMLNDDYTVTIFDNKAVNYDKIIGLWLNPSVTTSLYTGVEPFRNDGIYENISLFNFAEADYGKQVFAKQIDAVGSITYTLTQYDADTHNEMLVIVGTVNSKDSIKVNITNEVFYYNA